MSSFDCKQKRKPAFRLEVLGNLSRHEDAPPVALSGRVWVYCDAGKHAIEPGDLLTTSATPGHAMKVMAPVGKGDDRSSVAVNWNPAPV